MQVKLFSRMMATIRADHIIACSEISPLSDGYKTPTENKFSQSLTHSRELPSMRNARLHMNRQSIVK